MRYPKEVIVHWEDSGDGTKFLVTNRSIEDTDDAGIEGAAVYTLSHFVKIKRKVTATKVRKR